MGRTLNKDPLGRVAEGQRRTKYLMEQRGLATGTRPESPLDNLNSSLLANGE